MAPNQGPEKIMALSRGFMESRILLTGAELNLFSHLASQALTAEELAEKTGFFLRPLTVVLDALAALELLSKTGERYQTPSHLVKWLSDDSPQSALPMIRHANGLWNRWSNLTKIVKETGGVNRLPAVFDDQEETRAFIGAMHAVGIHLADEVVREIAPGQAKRLLDIGGASGTYTIAFLQACPQMRATLFDFPEIVEMARARLTRAGLLDRVTLVGGNFYEDNLPNGHDLALLSAIIHQNSLAQNLELFRKAFQALEPGGRIVIRDHVMNPDRTRPRSGALFAVNMLVGTPGGGTYTYQEIKEGLEQAGFVKVNLIQEKEPMRGLLEAFRPQ
ncbi:MAG: methyltransferase [Thermodesulfobacteriota bacterium]